MSTSPEKALVLDYFEKMRTGDPGLPELLHDDVTWWVPPGSDMAGTYEGKAKVLEFMGGAVDLYSQEHPMTVTLEHVVAEGDRVCVEFVLEAKTARGLDYRNHYHFAFRIQDGRIREVREYVDTKTAHELLFAGA